MVKGCDHLTRQLYQAPQIFTCGFFAIKPGSAEVYFGEASYSTRDDTHITLANMEEENVVPNGSLQRGLTIGDVVVNDSTPCCMRELIRKILGKQIHIYSQAVCKKPILKLLKDQLVESGIHFVVRVEGGFYPASSNDKILGWIDRVVRDLIQGDEALKRKGASLDSLDQHVPKKSVRREVMYRGASPLQPSFSPVHAALPISLGELKHKVQQLKEEKFALEKQMERLVNRIEHMDMLVLTFEREMSRKLPHPGQFLEP